MDLLEQYLTALDGLSPEQAELKTQLKSMFQGVNREKGEALTDLTATKEKLNGFKSQSDELSKTKSDFDTLTKAMQGLDIDMSNIEKVAEKLKIEKTSEDKIKSLNDIATEAQTKLKEANDRLNRIDTEKKVKPLLEQAISEFKDKDGNPYKVIDKFIDDKELYDPALDSDVLLNNKITEVLHKGVEAQEKFIKDTGASFDENKVHNVLADGSRHFKTQGNQPDLTQLEKQMHDSGGDPDSVARYLDAAALAKK